MMYKPSGRSISYIYTLHSCSVFVCFLRACILVLGIPVEHVHAARPRDRMQKEIEKNCEIFIYEVMKSVSFCTFCPLFAIRMQIKMAAHRAP